MDLVADELSEGDVFLKSGADEKRSSAAVIEKLEQLRAGGISSKSLIRPGDTHLMGHVNQYRWLDETIFTEGDVKVIFGRFVAYLVTWDDPPRIIVVNDEIIASEARRTFEFLWRQSKKPTSSTAPKRFKGVDDV